MLRSGKGTDPLLNMGIAMRVLIVEDEPLLALQLEDELIEAGHEAVGFAMSSAEALELANRTMPDLVLLDVYLSNGSKGTDVAGRLAEAAAVVFVTATADELPDDLAGAIGVIEKPYTSRGMAAALRWIGRAAAGGVPPPPPAGLRLAPGFMPGSNGLYALA